jgi:hypothetical protein
MADYFPLDRDGMARANESSRAEYFWVCQEGGSTMTLRLKEGGGVVAVPLASPLRLVPDGVSVSLAERKVTAKVLPGCQGGGAN